MITETQQVIDRHIITIDKSIRDALAALNSLSGECMTLFVTNKDHYMLGTVTDGDIRRALVKGAALDDNLEKVIHRNFLFTTPNADLCEAISEGRKRHVRLLPVVDNGKVTDVIDLKKIKASLPIDAVLMAGGRGERLRPLTENIPKPLLPVGEKAIIDYNIEELEACNVKNIFVTVNYLAEMIERHFEGRKSRSNIKCIREPKRLGTLGSIALIEDLKSDNLLVMNSDLLTNINFEALYISHRQHDADITMTGVPYSVSVPYAIMQLNGANVAAIEEKPTYNYFANAGVYLMKRSIVASIPKGEYTDAPDFIAGAISSGAKVCCYPAEGTWIDIGSPDDYRYACELMKRKDF